VGRYVYDLKQDTVQPSQKLVPPAVEGSSGTTTSIAFAGVGSGGEGVVAQGMSSGHVIVWRLPSSLAANGGGEGDDVEVLNSILGAEGAEDGSATVGEGDEELVDFAPVPPAPLPRLAETAEPVIKQQQQQQQQQQQYKSQPASAPSLPTGSAADSDGGDSLDGDTPW
jgi:hypothetical protein